MPTAEGDYRYEQTKRNAIKPAMRSTWDKYERKPYDECDRCGEYKSTVIIFSENKGYGAGEKGGRYCYNCGRTSQPQGGASQKWIDKHLPTY